MSAPSGCYAKKAWNSYDMNKTRYKEWLDNVYELLIFKTSEQKLCQLWNIHVMICFGYDSWRRAQFWTIPCMNSLAFESTGKCA